MNFEQWLERVEAKLDKITDDHETRLRKLESRIYTAYGIAITGGITAVLSVINIVFGGGSPL